MKFTEEKANELQAKHNLAKSVINKWRFRNAIPSKYEKTNTAAQTKAHEVLCRKIVSVLECGFINRAVLGASTHTFTKQSYSGVYKEAEALAVKKEIQQIKLAIVKAFSSPSEAAFKRIISDQRLFLKIILADPLHYSRCIKFKNNNAFLEAETYELAKDKFMIAALQLSF